MKKNKKNRTASSNIAFGAKTVATTCEKGVVLAARGIVMIVAAVPIGIFVAVASYFLERDKWKQRSLRRRNEND